MSPTPEFLYTLRLVPRLRDDEAWTTDDETLVAKHFHHLQRLLDDGRLVLAGRTTDDDPLGLVTCASPTRRPPGSWGRPTPPWPAA